MRSGVNRSARKRLLEMGLTGSETVVIIDESALGVRVKIRNAEYVMSHGMMRILRDTLSSLEVR